MKHIIVIFLFFTAAMQAQDGKHERIKVLKTAYITEQLALTSTEAEKFWPIYNKYEEKFHDLRNRERNEIFKKIKEGLENLSESEANALIEKDIQLESEEVELRKQMAAELRKVISSKKIITLKKAEYEFKKELLDRYRNSKGEKKPK